MGRKLSAYNLHMKRTLKGKMKGKTKAQRKSIFKAAARAWKSKKRGNPKPRSKPKKSKYLSEYKKHRFLPRTKRRSNRRMGNTFNTQKLFKWVRVGSLLGPAVISALEPGTLEVKAKRIFHKYTGLNPVTGAFSWEYGLETYKPFIFTTAITAVVPKIGAFIKGLLK